MKYQRPHISTQEIGLDKPNFAQETYLCLGEQPFSTRQGRRVGVNEQKNVLKGNCDTHSVFRWQSL